MRTSRRQASAGSRRQRPSDSPGAGSEEDDDVVFLRVGRALRRKSIDKEFREKVGTECLRYQRCGQVDGRPPPGIVARDRLIHLKEQGGVVRRALVVHHRSRRIAMVVVVAPRATIRRNRHVLLNRANRRVNRRAYRVKRFGRINRRQPTIVNRRATVRQRNQPFVVVGLYVARVWTSSRHV